MESRYEVVRNGDHMLTHFKCDICHLCNIKGRPMEVSNLDYKIVPETIQRALLDSFFGTGSLGQFEGICKC